jgi:hypothetical protein
MPVEQRLAVAAKLVVHPTQTVRNNSGLSNPSMDILKFLKLSMPSRSSMSEFGDLMPSTSPTASSLGRLLVTSFGAELLAPVTSVPSLDLTSSSVVVDSFSRLIYT